MELLPANTLIFGYARSKIPPEKFRDDIEKGLEAADVPRQKELAAKAKESHANISQEREKENQEWFRKKRKDFLRLCDYCSGGYNDPEALKKVCPWLFCMHVICCEIWNPNS